MQKTVALPINTKVKYKFYYYLDEKDNILATITSNDYRSGYFTRNKTTGKWKLTTNHNLTDHEVNIGLGELENRCPDWSTLKIASLKKALRSEEHQHKYYTKQAASHKKNQLTKQKIAEAVKRYRMQLERNSERQQKYAEKTIGYAEAYKKKAEKIKAQISKLEKQD